MNKIAKNKDFFMRYRQHMMNALVNGIEITEEYLSEYIADPKLIGHILFLLKAFPDYRLITKDITATENKVFVRVVFEGIHSGQVEDIPSTLKEVKVPFALSYTIENEKIVDFSAIADEMEFFEQLGLSSDHVEV